jgi:hypothetical protein
MKKLILMTSALTLIGGAAAAEITIGAETTLSYGNWDTMNGDAEFNHETTVTFGLEETTNGVTYGGEIEITAESIENEDEDFSGSHASLFVSGDFGKFEYGQDDFDEIEDANEDEAGDIKYSYSMGDFTVSVVADVEGAHTDPLLDAERDWVVNLGYTTGAVTLGLESDSEEYSEATVDYDGGSFIAGAAFDTDDAWDVYVGTSFGDINAKLTYDSEEVAGIEVDGTAGDVSWAVSYNTDEELEASFDYTSGDLSIGVAHDSTNAGGFGDDAETILTVGYAFGDMASAEVLVNDQEEYELSVTLGFEF